jgi:hypothetical protein
MLGLRRVTGSRFAQALLAFAVLVVCAYLVYAVFDEWSYLRFLLPALAVLAILAATGLAPIIGRASARSRAVILFTLVLGIIAHGTWIARSKDTFRLSSQLQRVERAAAWIRDNAEPAAVLLSGEQSGSMRYYTGRSILRWDAATPESLTAVLAALDPSSRPVYIVLDAWENERFRLKLGSVAAVALDWPPALETGASHRTRVWRLSDRARFLRGERLEIIRQ